MAPNKLWRRLGNDTVLEFGPTGLVDILVFDAILGYNASIQCTAAAASAAAAAAAASVGDGVVGSDRGARGWQVLSVLHRLRP